MEKINQPGTAKFGNFINYYSFNNAEDRAILIPDNFLEICNFHSESKTINCLDIGCNAGVSFLEFFN